jgi:hypothetical protein
MRVINRSPSLSGKPREPIELERSKNYQKGVGFDNGAFILLHLPEEGAIPSCQSAQQPDKPTFVPDAILHFFLLPTLLALALLASLNSGARLIYRKALLPI